MSLHPQIVLVAVAFCSFSTGFGGLNAAETPNPSQHLADKVDRLLLADIQSAGQQPAALVNDRDFLRRVMLDLAGRIPTPAEMQEFAALPEQTRRGDYVEKLLSTDGFAKNWAAYWKDVIYSRATDQRTLPFQFVFEDWLKTEIERGAGWDEIVTQVLTATGNSRENGATALILAHEANPEELAGEVSRIFLGVQIQCAQCHNHPTDTWTREQFHELAAFFPRVRVRPLLNQVPRSFEIASLDVSRPDPRDLFNDPQRLLSYLDVNRDAAIDQEEASRTPRFGQVFARILPLGDQDGDGKLTVKELRELPEPEMNRRNTIEHFMSDLEDPSAEGTLMQPVFFLNDQRAARNLNDIARREKLAEYVTSPDNEWFAKAYVNRIWSELFGSGFYPLVDDLGPLREPRNEEVLNLLSQEFVRSGYDIKGLFRIVLATDAYQRQLGQDNQFSDEVVGFACATPTRLRADQIYESLTMLAGMQSAVRQRPGPYMMGGGPNGSRNQFAAIFGYDPSTPQRELQTTIPQSLFMMNSRAIEGLVSARGNTPLARLLRQYDDDEMVLRELYRLVLTRDPTAAEISICQDHYLTVRDRTAALEDIFWSLLNSSEFLTRR